MDARTLSFLPAAAFFNLGARLGRTLKRRAPALRAPVPEVKPPARGQADIGELLLTAPGPFLAP